METEGENAGGKKRKKGVPGRKSVDAGRKKRWREGENILTGLKCRKSGKQEKMPTLGKGTFFYRTSRKEGNKGNKNGGEKKKEGKDAEKNNGGKNHPEH